MSAPCSIAPSCAAKSTKRKLPPAPKHKRLLVLVAFDSPDRANWTHRTQDEVVAACRTLSLPQAKYVQLPMNYGSMQDLNTHPVVRSCESEVKTPNVMVNAPP